MGEIREEEVPLPSAESVVVAEGIALQPPLSRRGQGPGILTFVPPRPIDPSHAPDHLSTLQKWAEEGFAVVEIDLHAVGSAAASLHEVIELAIDALEKCPACEGARFGAIVYDTDLGRDVAMAVTSHSKIVALVGYGNQIFGESSRPGDPTPYLHHLAGEGVGQTRASTRNIVHEYTQAKSPSFAVPDHEGFHHASESLSHSRNLGFLKKHIGGPYFDLEAIWDEHTRYEFGDRSVARTMGTMVQEPYVNHIPTMTGGIGRKRLTNFYRHHFIFSNPEDTELELVSRTVGIDRIVDEFVFCFTHNRQIDWILPGVPPTGKHVRVPFTSVVNVRGDRLYHEHIAWDQASVLVQLGLMPQYLPFPYDLPDGTKPAPGKRFEYQVPAAGLETARKLLDRSSVPSNQMFEHQVREVDV
ncbi:carboxymethylenebutenolidase [Amylocarpus encephaloides]|uniref:Carboxymethylenebutenolidase n=1 Tax=Amylocarpus encephaloides TaxID=45428 RepID=A0A9P7YLG4_9HELO|nr:carboxymethylenebutenolidase [Amylocarpus encephaloides]